MKWKDCFSKYKNCTFTGGFSGMVWAADDLAKIMIKGDRGDLFSYKIYFVIY